MLSAPIAKEFADVFARYQAYLAANGVDRNAAPGVLGAWATLDPVSERFVGEFADRAQAIATAASIASRSSCPRSVRTGEK